MEGSNFAAAHPFEDRLSESRRVRDKHRGSAPVIVEPHDDKTPVIDKSKFLVPWELTYGQLVYVVRKRLKMTSDQSIFLFCDRSILPLPCDTIRDIHRAHGSSDGFLYITYALENTFG
jgi:GABA(A) receptor-associated protein